MLLPFRYQWDKGGDLNPTQLFTSLLLTQIRNPKESEVVVAKHGSANAPRAEENGIRVYWTGTAQTVQPPGVLCFSLWYS